VLNRPAQRARARRDRDFRLAAIATGEERAEHLHQGIMAVVGLLGSIEDRGDDPVLVFYKPQVEEIREADGTERLRGRCGAGKRPGEMNATSGSSASRSLPG
jgi:hypothetical protein